MPHPTSQLRKGNADGRMFRGLLDCSRNRSFGMGAAVTSERQNHHRQLVQHSDISDVDGDRGSDWAKRNRVRLLLGTLALLYTGTAQADHYYPPQKKMPHHGCHYSVVDEEWHWHRPMKTDHRGWPDISTAWRRGGPCVQHEGQMIRVMFCGPGFGPCKLVPNLSTRFLPPPRQHIPFEVLMRPGFLPPPDPPPIATRIGEIDQRNEK